MVPRTAIALGAVSTLAAASFALVGCGDDDVAATDSGPGDLGMSDAADAARPDAERDADTDAGSSRCPAIEARRRVEISADLVTDVRWTCDELYVLTTVVFVRAGATLTIDPGVVVHGEEDAVLLVATDGYIVAEGTADAPITFTSAKPPGMRARGDWGGVMLLGLASTNRGPDVITVEGGPLEEHGTFGGDDDEHDCGSLRFVRIQFVGSGQSMGDDLNALTLAGCGRATRVEFVHAHFVRGDGIELQGGTADLRHVLVTRADDDALDWDQGWRGRVQFLVSQPDPFAADAALEGDSHFGEPGTEPRSHPVVFNATLLGPDLPGGTQTAILLRSGTRALVHDALLVGFPGHALDVIGAATATSATHDLLAVSHSLFFDIGRGGTTWFDPADANDGGFDESAYLMDEALANRFGVDPDLPRAFDLAAPVLVPSRDSPAATGALVPPDDGFFDPGASYLGAFAPGGVDWTEGWTERPES
ncbi:MAG: hypothetical protein IT379_00685 [Deltaproteobacteria bacterium]|nr:hypothetical protein [Deltaproteobacteria bacterium]